MSDISTANLREHLSEHFGFDSFKGTQEEIIDSILNQHDTFVIMPTGGGKSLCYQLPAMMLEGTAIVISPLIALMKNQVDLIRGYSNKENVAHFLNSSLSKSQSRKVKEDLLSGETKLLYVAPETLNKPETAAFLRQIKISFIAVDEAHCISEWGHDFRPEYRKIKKMIDEVHENIPIIALTATATPKVQADISKTLGLTEPNVFISSFNRHNLYYEIRPKGKKAQVQKEIIQFIKKRSGKSGIVYCLSRKSTEELANILKINGIKASAYHAGLDPNTRSSTQDKFLMEEVDVIVATIAFGMGIDKPDIRYVIHHDIPKSLENYYQETGRAGRDGLEGHCLAFFNHQDVNKLEKFMRDKPVSERDIGSQHLMEVVGYAETGGCRRRFLLHYFGEQYDDSNCHAACDNCKHTKEKIDATNDVKTCIEAVEQLQENFDIKYTVNFLLGDESQQVQSFKHDKLPTFGRCKGKDKNFLNSIIRQALLHDLLTKDIENYGILKMNDKGQDYLTQPYKIEIALNHDYHDVDFSEPVKTTALDNNLFKMLLDLRKSVAKQKKLPPFVIFQDPSLEDMATQYPITMDEMANITGVSKGKAIKYGRQFVQMIAEYVEANDIDRPNEVVIKSVASKSKAKVQIIQNIDKRVPLDVIAESVRLETPELLTELESIVQSGTKVNLDYVINDVLDEYQQEDLYDYFMQAESDSVAEALKEMEEDEFTEEDVRLMRIKFLSEMAN